MKYLQQLENKMEAKFEELANDMRSLKATTELSGEIRNARKLNKTLKLEDENCNLKEKVKNQSYLQQFRLIRDHLNSECLTSIIVFDFHVRLSIQ